MNQPPGWPPPYGPPPVVQLPPTSAVAVIALVFGIIGALGGWCMLGIPCAIAILCGHLGLRETRDGRASGRGVAIAALVLGYLFVVPWAAVAFFGGLGAISGR